MSRFSFVVVALVAAVAFATDVTLEMESKVNLTDAASNFAFRFTTAKMVDAGLLATQCKAKYSGCEIPKNFYIWSSSSVSLDKVDTTKSVIDGMLAVAFPPSEHIFPFSVFAYGTGASSVGLSMVDLMNKVFIAQGLGSFEGGVVGMAALSLEEFTPDGKYVDDTIVLLNSDTCSPKEIEGKKGLKGMTCVMNLKNKATSNNFKVTVTYVTSDKAGILKYGKTPVSPRSIEMIIEVEDFQLTDKKNHVRMNLGFVTASGDIDYDGNAKFIVKNDEKIYVAASGHAMVGDARADVDVNFTSGSLPEGLKATFDAIVGLLTGFKFDLSITHVDFPAGAQSFIYDPATGTGSNVYMAGASTVTLSALVLLVCALLFLF